jgi:pyrroline-5-carboxylate reductase
MVIAFVGAGKMARALAGALLRGRVMRAEDFICSSRSEESGRPFLEMFPGARWTGDIAAQTEDAQLVVLAIKPQQFGGVLPTLKTAGRDKLFLSLAAGITLEKLRGWLDPSARIIRVMPNTPMQIGQGASVYAGGPDVTEEDFELVGRILSAAGKAWRVEEAQIDAITSLSGSGPAYVFHFIEALVKGGTAAGLEEKFARELAIQTVLGAAQLAAASTLTPRELAEQVKSPGGTTLAACAELEKDDALNRLMERCMTAARRRAAELAQG